MYAPKVYQALHGVFCIYKPASESMKSVIATLKGKLGSELNKMPPLRQESYCEGVTLYDSENSKTDLPVITTLPDLSDHRLVVGPRYLREDFHLGTTCNLSHHSSGVLVVGIGSGCRVIKTIQGSRHLRVYHVKGEFGTATDDFFSTGRILERSTYKHVSLPKLDRLISAVQSGHQRQQFFYAGLDEDSEEAYEAACEGLIRPMDDKTPPILYSIKCIDFQPPTFTLEIHAINEYCTYLAKLIHEIGLELKTNAICKQIRRIRHGYFTLDHALLQKHWTAEHILNNIDFCKPSVKRENLGRIRLMRRRKIENNLLEA